jgi:hypothetical protein
MTVGGPATTVARSSGAVEGGVSVVLRLEGLALFLGATVMFGLMHGRWSRYGLLFLAPDLSFVFYLAGPRAGAVAYNTLHSTIGPLLLGLAGYAGGITWAGPIALIWLAHIGFDRAAGFGLKYTGAFGDTHLGLSRRR